MNHGLLQLPLSLDRAAAHHVMVQHAPGAQIIRGQLVGIHPEKLLLRSQEVLRTPGCFVDCQQTLGIAGIALCVLTVQVIHCYAVKPGNLRQEHHIG